MLKRTFESRKPKILEIAIYISLVRLHLEYDVQAKNSHLQRDIEGYRGNTKGYRVQKRAKKFSLSTLKNTRLRGD